MKRLFILQSVLAVVLLFLVAVQGARVVERHFPLRFKLGGPGSATLRESTLSYLKGLRGRVSATYFVSARRTMPSSMKAVEDEVRRLLERMKRAAPEKFDYRVLDPELDPGSGEAATDVRPGGKVDVKVAYASGRGASPVKIRKVLRDESSEEAVWSSLSLAHDQHPDALIQGITSADLAYLEDWVVENLRAAQSPPQPVIAIASPSRGFSRVRDLVRALSADPQRGVPAARIVEVDLDHDPHIPLEADWLLWIEPRIVTRDHAAELERFLKSGRSAVVAGSTHGVDYLARADGKFGYRITHSPCDWKTLLQPFGLSFTPLLVLDKNHEAISWKQADGSLRAVDAPFHLRILPTLFNTRSLLGPNAGALLVSAISPIQTDPGILAASGRTAEVVATTSEHARVLDLLDGEFDDGMLEGAVPVSKQPWLVLSKSRDEWQGDLLVAGTSVLFHDDPYAQGGNANQVFFRTLLRTYTHGPRLARIRVPRPEPPAVPPLSLASRIAWRGVTVFVVPAVFLLLALRTGVRRRRGPVRVAWTRPILAGVVGLAVILTVTRLWRSAWDPVLDLTEDSINTPSPLTSRLLEGVRGGLEAELLISDSIHMPASLRQLEPRILGTLRGLGIHPRIIRPEDLPPGEQTELNASGIEPFDIETIENDARVTARVRSALRLERSGQTATIPRLDPRTAEHLEFLLAAAAKRLQGARPPRVGVLSDLPRLSAAEAHEDFQTKGYTAPVGTDVYSFARELLARYGYDVVYINPDSPVFPPDMAVIVWLQPRFPWKAFPQFAKFMNDGGKAFVAVQHYNVQQRQYRGAGFDTVYWPQPQFHGFNEYLSLIGARQIGDKVASEPGEVLFDRSHANLTLDTQVNRSAFREYDQQQVSRPFLIRVAGDGLSQDSVITSRLSDLLFIWGSRFTLDEDRIRQGGLTSKILASTSPRSWSYAWSGGWIPEASFLEPEAPNLGRQPLAVLLEGPFPPMELKKGEGARDTLALVDGAAASPRPGEMLLVGCSEMFKNAHLFAQDFQHDQFLLNSVASLAHGDELAAVQARRRTPKSFLFLPPEIKIFWRTIAVGLGPVLFLAFGAVWRLQRRRPVLWSNA
ncbi:MAG TPA: Gldg family protein [Planctomycetota bacterium]|nr:Gldg family protein [Planctomycetota bacterium]